MAKGLPRLRLEALQGVYDNQHPASIPAGTISKFLDEDEEDSFDIHSWRREFTSELTKVTTPASFQGKPQQLASTTSFQSLASGASSKGFNSLPPLHAKEAESGLGSEERVNISQAVFAPYDSLHNHMCRGNLNSILELRECCAVQSARERLKIFEEVGIEQRRKAHEWGEKEQRRKAKAQEKDDGTPTAQSARPSRQANASSASLVKAFARGKLPVKKEEPPSTPKTSSIRKSIVARKSVVDAPKKVSVAFQHGSTMPMVSDEDSQHFQDEMRSKGLSFSDDMRAQIWAGREQRTANSQKRGDEKTKDKFMDSERDVLHEVFSYYCADGETMALTNLIRCLFELGLAGSTYHERAAVEKLLIQVYDSLVQEQGSESLGQALKPDQRAKGRSQDPDAGSKHGIFCVLFPRELVKRDDEDDSDEKFPQKPYASVALAVQELVDRRAEAGASSRSVWFGANGTNIMRLIPVTFEDFVAEIVPMVRLQLNEMRREHHLRLFHEELHSTKTLHTGNMLTSAEFIDLGKSIGLDMEETSEVVHDALAALKSRNARLDKCWIDSESFHALLLFVEERCARKLHIMERQIMRDMQLSEGEFWRFRTHLATVKDLMQSMTGKEMKLQRVEVMQLLKQMGFQPYHTRQLLMVQDALDCIHSIDVVPFTFKETLKAADLVRSKQKAARQEKLWRCFQQMKPSGRATMPIHMVENNLLFNPTLELNLRITNVKEQGALKRAIDESDTLSPGDVNFQELEELCQKTFECMHGNTARDIFQRARAEGLSLDLFYEYQQLFDHYDTDCSGSLDLDEVREALRLKMGKSATAADIQQIYATKGLNIDLPLQIWDFLRLMDASIALSKPFTLRDLAVSRLRECLGFFPVRLDQIVHVQEHELPVVVASFLGCSVDDNLKELPEKVSSAQQLIHYARVKGREYREHSKATKGSVEGYQE